MRISRGIGAVLFALSAAENVAAQSNPAQTTPPVSPEAVSATIYITAATKKGILVTDLKPEDLAITEDKVPAKIEQVSCGRHEPILVGILADVSGSRRSDSHVSSHYDALVAFLDSLLSTDDATYLAAFDDKYYQLSNVTADRAAISAAFEKSGIFTFKSTATNLRLWTPLTTNEWQMNLCLAQWTLIRANAVGPLWARVCALVRGIGDLALQRRSLLNL